MGVPYLTSNSQMSTDERCANKNLPDEILSAKILLSCRSNAIQQVSSMSEKTNVLFVSCGCAIFSFKNVVP